MNKKKELSSPKPNTRVMMIQETEAELKMIVKRAHMEGHSRRQLSHDTYTAIYRLIRELDNEELARKCAIAFPRYVNKLNNEYSEVFRLLQAMPVTPRYASPDTEIVVQAPNGRIRTIPRMAEIPDYAFERGVAAHKYGEEYIKEVRLRLRNVAALAAKEDYASNVSLRNVAEMQIRYEKHLDDLDLLKSKGTKLVWISIHSNCSARCAPYQGRLYSLDGTSGITPEGVPYEPLEKATDVYYTTKAGVKYKNGLFGFNCRHEMTEYTPGSKPVTIPDAVIKRQREIEKTQREFERAIRYERTLYEVSRGLGHKETDILANQAWHRKVDLNEKYKAFCEANGLAYPAERVQIFKDTELDIFKDKLLSKNKLSSREIPLVNHLTKDAESGKIKLGNAATRVWYNREISQIHDFIDPKLSIEEKAKLAFEARNRIRIKARDMMKDAQARKELDAIAPNHTFEELIADKMSRKKITRQEALEDIYRTAIKSNKKVNKKTGLDDDE